MTLSRGIDFADYAAIDAVNWSLLKEMAKSPAHYLYRATHPRPDSSRMAFGRAVHTAVLEPDRFPLEYVVFDGARRAGKVWDEFAEVNAGRTILKAEEYETCLAVRDAVLGNDFCADLLRGESEVTAEWVDETTGIACKGRLDHVNEDCIVDLKTTGSVEDWTFSALSARMLYHAQLAFYSRGVHLAHNPRIIAVEADAPHDVAVFKVTDDLMVAGNQLVSDLLARLAVCRQTGRWPGRYGAEVELTMPGWLAPDPDGGGWNDLPERSAE